jgi:hypothetical protein
MGTAPKDGTAVLVLLNGSDVPHAARWLNDTNSVSGWYLVWDHCLISEYDGPRYWMHCPDDPDKAALKAERLTKPDIHASDRRE